jgi:hypothetical protein
LAIFYQIIEKYSSDASGDSSMCDPEVIVAPGLVLGVVLGVVLVAGRLQGRMEVLSVVLVQVITGKNTFVRLGLFNPHSSL